MTGMTMRLVILFVVFDWYLRFHQKNVHNGIVAAGSFSSTSGLLHHSSESNPPLRQKNVYRQDDQHMLRKRSGVTMKKKASTSENKYIQNKRGKPFRHLKLIDVGDKVEVVENEYILILDPDQFRDSSREHVRDAVMKLLHSSQPLSKDLKSDNMENSTSSVATSSTILHVYFNIIKGALIQGVPPETLDVVLNDKSVKSASPNKRISLYTNRKSNESANIRKNVDDSAKKDIILSNKKVADNPVTFNVNVKDKDSHSSENNKNGNSQSNNNENNNNKGNTNTSDNKSNDNKSNNHRSNNHKSNNRKRNSSNNNNNSMDTENHKNSTIDSNSNNISENNNTKSNQKKSHSSTNKNKNNKSNNDTKKSNDASNNTNVNNYNGNNDTANIVVVSTNLTNDIGATTKNNDVKETNTNASWNDMINFDPNHNENNGIDNNNSNDTSTTLESIDGSIHEDVQFAVSPTLTHHGNTAPSVSEINPSPSPLPTSSFSPSPTPSVTNTVTPSPSLAQTLHFTLSPFSLSPPVTNYIPTVIPIDVPDNHSDFESSGEVTTTKFQQTGVTLPWHLDRIDQSTYPLDGEYRYNYDGTGVQIYFIDTGLRTTHVEFATAKNAFCGMDLVFDSDVPCEDNNGHGTHVAALAGGHTYGVAKNASLISLKVFDSNGDSSGANFLLALDYVVGVKRSMPHIPIIVSASLGGPRNDFENELVNGIVKNDGIVVVAAAGNDGTDACTSSPASVQQVITVGAVEPQNFANSGSTTGSNGDKDKIASYSNYGSCVDVFAPGTNILSADGRTSDTGTMTLNGTSQATPIVAGIVALYLQRRPNMSPNEVFNDLVNNDSIKDNILFEKQNLSPNRVVSTQKLND